MLMRQVASSSNEALNEALTGYIPIVERKLHEYIVAFNSVKAEVDKREKEGKIDEKKAKPRAEREEKKTLAGKPITINIRFDWQWFSYRSSTEHYDW